MFVYFIFWLGMCLCSVSRDIGYLFAGVPGSCECLIQVLEIESGSSARAIRAQPFLQLPDDRFFVFLFFLLFFFGFF